MKEEQYLICSIWGKQYAYWVFLDGKVVSLKAMECDTEPLPEIIVGRN